MLVWIEPQPVPDYVPATNARHPAARSTVRDVAARLPGSERHVRDLIARGDLRAVREGNRWLVLPADLDAYVASLPVTATPTADSKVVKISRDRRKAKGRSA